MNCCRYQWLFFDADGTLFDFEKAQAVALERVFQHHQVPYRAFHLDAFRQINAELWQALEEKRMTTDELKVKRFELLLGTIGVKHAAEPFAQVYLEHLGSCPKLIDGAVELLEELSREFHIAILTNGLRSVQRRRLECSAIRGYVSGIVVSEEIGFAKPAREYFDVAFTWAGNPSKREVLMIGDGWNSDIKGAASYGIDACWYNPGREPRPALPEIAHEIAALKELPPLLARCGIRNQTPPTSTHAATSTWFCI